MHINHRRKNKFRAKHHNEPQYSDRWYSPGVASWVYWRRKSNRKRRSRVRRMILRDRYDSLPTRYHKDVMYQRAIDW